MKPYTPFYCLRALLPLALGVLMTAGGLLMSATSAAQTVTVVMPSGLRVLDPVLTTAYMTRDHGWMIYDTLVGVDASFTVRPQMASWQVSDDGKRYVFTLRDGLAWHDGAPVTAEDCVASIRRWAQVDVSGQILLTMVERIAVLDEQRFEVRLNTPTRLLLEGLAKQSSRPAFMMPKRVADTPATTAITETIGSGPFKFVAAQFQPGVKAVYEKSSTYRPRAEPPEWTAGGKVVNVARVEWVAMPDPMTAVNALVNGEVDFIREVPFDLLPMIENRDDLRVQVLDPLGSWTYFRMNHLHPPFNHKLLRQAALLAVAQQDVLQALVGDPQYYQTCAATLGCGTLYGNSYGEAWVVPAHLDRARALLQEAHYDGAPVVILQATDIAMQAAQPIVIGAALRQAGFNVVMKAMDWQTVVTQRESRNAPEQGGWSLTSSYSILAASSDLFSNPLLSGAGLNAWAGWPDVPAIEALRKQFARTTDQAERQQIAARIQKLAIDEVMVVPLGQFRIPSAYSATLSNVMASPVAIFWHIKKSIN